MSVALTKRAGTFQTSASVSEQLINDLVAVQPDGVGYWQIVEARIVVVRVLWESRRDQEMGDPAWLEVAAFWQSRFRELATTAVASLSH